MTDSPKTRAGRSAIVRDGIAIGVASGAYAVSFGALSVAAGLTVLQTCALSLLAFTGASQFALVGVVASGGAPVSGTLTALLLGTRNALYGLRLAPLLDWHGWRRAAAAQMVIDESTAMSVNRAGTPAARVGFLATGASVYLLWNLGTAVGAVAGRALGDPKAYGLDAAVGGAFLALLWPRLRDRRNRLTAVLAVALALSLVQVAPAGLPVLAAASLALVVAAAARSPDPTETPSGQREPSGEQF